MGYESETPPYGQPVYITDSSIGPGGKPMHFSQIFALNTDNNLVWLPTHFFPSEQIHKLCQYTLFLWTN